MDHLSQSTVSKLSSILIVFQFITILLYSQILIIVVIYWLAGYFGIIDNFFFYLFYSFLQPLALVSLDYLKFN